MVIFIICCIFVVNTSYSQNSQHYNPKTNINSVPVDDFLLATEEIRLTDYPQFNLNLLELDNQKATFSTNQKCYFQFLKAYQTSYNGNLKKAITDVSDLLNHCQSPFIKVRLNSLLANISAISGNYQQAISSLDDLLKNPSDYIEHSSKIHAYTAAFLVYDLVNQNELSLKYTDLIEKEDIPNKILCKSKVYKNSQKIKIDKSDYNDKTIFNIINFCEKENQNIYAYLLLNWWLVNKLNQTNDKNQIIPLLKQLQAYDKKIEKTQYKNLIGVKNSLFAQIHEKLDNREEAIKYAQLAVDGSLSIGDTGQKIKALQVLINYYQMIGDYKLANEYLIEKNKSENKFYTDKQAKLMAYLTVKHDSLANTFKIKSLDQENKVLQLQNEIAEKAKTNQRLISLLMGSLLLFAIILIYRIKRQQQKFKKLAELDHMTLIYNRKGIRDHMDYLLPYAQKKQETIGFAIFDLDHFKNVNDDYGHIVGDWVIKNCILACQKTLNEKVTLARIGGEEFTIVIRDSSLEEIQKYSERCRQAIYAIKTLAGTNHDFKISASFGITTTKFSGYDYAKLLTHADKALYQAKDNGRNQVTTYQTG